MKKSNHISGPKWTPKAIISDEAITMRTLSSIGPNSYLSTNDATAPEIAPQIGIDGSALFPIKYPSGIHRIAMPRFPQALFVRLANILLRIIPVTPSPYKALHRSR